MDLYFLRHGEADWPDWEKSDDARPLTKRGKKEMHEVAAFLKRVKARELQPDGSYRRLKPEGPEPRSQAQWHFREVTRERAKKLGRKKSPPADKLIPITVAPPPPKQS